MRCQRSTIDGIETTKLKTNTSYTKTRTSAETSLLAYNTSPPPIIRMTEKALTSDEAVSKTMQQGFEKMVVQAGIGLVVGGMAGIVLSRGGGSSARKVLAGFGAGAGIGSAWTRCSMDIEDLLVRK